MNQDKLEVVQKEMVRVNIDILGISKLKWTGMEEKEQDHPQEKDMQKSKMADWGGLINSCEKKRSKKQRRKGKIYPFECSVPKNSKER